MFNTHDSLLLHVNIASQLSNDCFEFWVILLFGVGTVCCLFSDTGCLGRVLGNLAAYFESKGYFQFSGSLTLVSMFESVSRASMSFDRLLYK